MNIETKVYELIDERVETMKTLDPTTDEYKANAEVALKFIDRAVEIEKIHIEDEANRLKAQQMEEDLKDRKTRNWLTALGIAIPPVTAVVAACVFSVIERTEIVSNTAPREFLKRALRLS